jgi:hypothetical protein
VTAARLERVARGEIKRLAVFMPPGSAKSTYGSILFPPHVMAGAPGRSLLAASHTTEVGDSHRMMFSAEFFGCTRE